MVSSPSAAGRSDIVYTSDFDDLALSNHALLTTFFRAVRVLGRMKLRALGMTSAGIERCLRWLGEPVDPATLAPARDPPYFKSQVIRRRLGEPDQAEVFDAPRGR